MIAGNWKMNGNHFEALALVQKLAFALKSKDFDAAEVVVLPPFTSLRSVQTLVAGDKLRIRYGAQDVSPHRDGAYTGDISAAMLAKLGCSYVLAGHSERRQHHGEDDALVNAKIKALIGADIVPVLCVGESLEARQEGRHLDVVRSQLDGGLAKVPEERVASMVIAYEPVWAIGTGEVATPEDAQEVCAAIRHRISGLQSSETGAAVRILYGGSVKAANISAIMDQQDVDGALVGGASLDAGEFVRICRYREHVQRGLSRQ
ncbi:MAG TPA: triose-phosphate isomerase [Streptosporangiaceae bacterium]|jgi:triosephosphate isomerase